MAAGNLAVDPVMQLATIGVSGVGAQWVAWRQRVPAIVLMLSIGLLAGSMLGVLDPKAVLGDLMTPIISIAVAVILFEGDLILNFHQPRGASRKYCASTCTQCTYSSRICSYQRHLR